MPFDCCDCTASALSQRLGAVPQHHEGLCVDPPYLPVGSHVQCQACSVQQQNDLRETAARHWAQQRHVACQLLRLCSTVRQGQGAVLLQTGRHLQQLSLGTQQHPGCRPAHATGSHPRALQVLLTCPGSSAKSAGMKSIARSSYPACMHSMVMAARLCGAAGSSPLGGLCCCFWRLVNAANSRGTSSCRTWSAVGAGAAVLASPLAFCCAAACSAQAGAQVGGQPVGQLRARLCRRLLERAPQLHCRACDISCLPWLDTAVAGMPLPCTPVTHFLCCCMLCCCFTLLVGVSRHEGVTEPQVQGLDEQAGVQLQCGHQQTNLAHHKATTATQSSQLAQGAGSLQAGLFARPRPPLSRPAAASSQHAPTQQVTIPDPASSGVSSPGRRPPLPPARGSGCPCC